MKNPLIFVVKLITDAVLNATETTTSATVGGGGATTVSVTVAGAVVPPGPVAAKVKLSDPTKSAFGTYVITFPTIATMAPLTGGVTTAMVFETPVICEDRSRWSGVLKTTLAARLATVGRGGALTVMNTVATADVPPGPVA